MSQTDENTSDEFIRDAEMYFDNDFLEFQKRIEDDYKELKEIYETDFMTFTATLDVTARLYENILNDTNRAYSLTSRIFELKTIDLFLAHLLREILDSPISRERYSEVKEYLSGNDILMSQIHMSYSFGYNVGLVITKNDVYFVSIDEYILNLTRYGFNGPPVVIFINQYLHLDNGRDSIRGVEELLEAYYSEECSELYMKKGKDYNSLGKKVELVGDDTRFVTLKDKYPHAKIELNTYKGKINKYLITEKFKLKKMK